MGTALCEITERPSVHAQGATNGGDEICEIMHRVPQMGVMGSQLPLAPQGFIELGDKSGETDGR